MPLKGIILLFLSLLYFQSCTSKDSIVQNQVFKDGDVLVSSGNSFAFGFFSPGKSPNRYAGIWYNKISEQTVVWVANRDNPINGTNGILTFENSGNFVLLDQSNSNNMVLWSTNVSATVTDACVQLLDTGNLVLRHCQNKDITIWESFLYPTNTLLPHMKIGVNRTSGLAWSLTSWKSLNDPGTGDFVLNMDLDGPPQISLYKNSVRFWRSGPWNGVTLGGAPDMSKAFAFMSVNYIENDEEVSYSYSITDPSVISRVIVNETGLKERQTWHEDQHVWTKYLAVPKDECDYYGHCGSFSKCDPSKLGVFECDCLPGSEVKFESEWNLRDGHSGCKRASGEPMCGNNSTSNARFIKLPFVKVPDTRNAVLNASLGLKECADLCWKNCSCTAYASANVSNGGIGCITWYGDLMDVRQYSSNGGQDLYTKVSESAKVQYYKSLNRSRSKKWIIFLVPSIAGVLLLFVAIWLLWKGKDKTNGLWKLLGYNSNPVSSYGATSRTEEIDKNGDFSLFDLKTISVATNSFADANKLGEGGFGSVYKGQLQNGKEIAVKRLSKCSGQGIEEFKNEVTLIARLQHRNLVKLLGCCIQQEEKMLVYEYLPNKALDNFIFDKEKGALLDWKKRLHIILGIARGIVYLHRDSRLRIIHRDLKASNVLLDANMEPKISDFGMAKSFNADQVLEDKTRRVVGTYGYMSPEYVMRGIFSEKSDVFSYGVLLLEIISGRRNNSFFGDNVVNLTGYIWEIWKEGNVLDIVDPVMGESYNPDEVVKCIRIGLLCVQEHTNDRPTMSEVLSMLCNETSIPTVFPKQPAFVLKKVICNKNYLPWSSSSPLRPCVDVASITIVEAR